RRAFIRSPIARAALRSRRTVKVSQPRAVRTARVHVRTSRGQSEVLRAGRRADEAGRGLRRVDEIVRVLVVPVRDGRARARADVVPDRAPRRRDTRAHVDTATEHLYPSIND